MFKSKKIRIACLAAAIFLASGGVFMFVYAAALEKTIGGKIKFYPVDGKLEAYYQRFSKEATPLPEDSGFQRITALDTGNSASIPELDLTNTDGFIVFKLVLSTTYSSSEYYVKYTISIAVSDSVGMYVSSSSSNGVKGAVFGVYDSVNKSYDITAQDIFTLTEGVIYARIGLENNATPGDKTIGINVSITATKK